MKQNYLYLKYIRLAIRLEKKITSSQFHHLSSEKKLRLAQRLERYYSRLIQLVKRNSDRIKDKVLDILYYRKTKITLLSTGLALSISSHIKAQQFVLDTTSEPFGLSNVGNFSVPTFVDIDNDGDFDAFVGEGDGDINFFENTGTNSSPAFSLSTESSPFDLFNIGSNSALTFVDIDNDGDFDAFVGENDGRINFFENKGTNSTPAFSSNGQSHPFGLSDVGRNTTPTFVDIDNDGDLDAFVGERYGNTYFFQNTGTTSSPAFSLSPESLPFGLSSIGFRGTPAFVDIDNDGDLDAFVGENDGDINFFINNNPEIALLGNNADITDGDTTPSASDDTNLGSVDITSAMVSKTFSIRNTGDGNLTLSGIPLVSISGTHSADFSVTSQPASPITPNGSSTFTIQFDPSAVGSRTASVSISNNDADETPFNFDIQGEGTTSVTLSPTSNNKLMFGDPCNCTDPLNFSDGTTFFFHDTLTVTPSTPISGLTIGISGTSTDFFVGSIGSVQLASATNTPMIPEVPSGSGIYKLEFWRPSGATPVVNVSLNGGTPIMVPSTTFDPVCTEAACNASAIPTIGQWAIIILGLFMSILGVLGLVTNKESLSNVESD